MRNKFVNIFHFRIIVLSSAQDPVLLIPPFYTPRLPSFTGEPFVTTWRVYHKSFSDIKLLNFCLFNSRTFLINQYLHSNMLNEVIIFVRLNEAFPVFCQNNHLRLVTLFQFRHPSISSSMLYVAFALQIISVSSDCPYFRTCDNPVF